VNSTGSKSVISGLPQKQLNILASWLQAIFDRYLIRNIREIAGYSCGFTQSDQPDLSANSAKVFLLRDLCTTPSHLVL